MLFFSRSKILMILGAVILGLFFAAPNAMKADLRDNLPGTFQRTINLGLDLQGGAHMLLAVDLSTVIDQALENERDAIQDTLRNDGERLATATSPTVQGKTIFVQMRTVEDADKAFPRLQNLSVPIDAGSLGGDRTTKVTRDSEKVISVEISDANVEYIRQQTIDKSIGVLRRRIDPQGVLELTLAPEGNDRILLQVPGAQNIDDIKGDINTSATLAFNLSLIHI